MTTQTEKREPVHAETDKATGSRWYVHPTTGERFISVTTVLGYISKFGLTDWSARLAAEAAVARLPWLVRCSRVEPCNVSKTEDACGSCRECATLWLANRHIEVRDQAGERGSKLHEAAEQLELFGEGATVDPDIVPLVDSYRRWRSFYRPEFLATEMTVISRKWGYAGTLDGILRFPGDSPLPTKLKHIAGKPVVGDTKGLSLDTPIPTPTGWTTVAAVQPGELVFGSDGKPCKVIDKSEVRWVDCYRLRFDDGSEIVCDGDHRWPTVSGPWHAMSAQVLDTRTIAASIRGSNGQRQHRVPTAGPLELPEAGLPIEPYTFGCWLGDGKTAGGEITKPDDELFTLITESSGLQVGQNTNHTGHCQTRTVYGLRSLLRRHGFLGNKHVPDAYLRSSVAQRLALLQGLMDTDGTWHRSRKQASFVSTDKAIAQAVRELALSLGERATIQEVTARGYGREVTAWPVVWRPLRHNPFRLARKAHLVTTVGTVARSHRRMVVAAEPTVTVPTQCLTVDSPDHTYLCGEQFIPTHNTGRHLGMPEGWQVNAYAHADVVLLPDGSEEPMPPIEGGLILHIRPDKPPKMREAHLTDANHAKFVHMLRVVEGLTAGLGTVLSRPVNLPKEALS